MVVKERISCLKGVEMRTCRDFASITQIKPTFKLNPEE